jgi:glucose/arabinose dehydrogenase
VSFGAAVGGRARLLLAALSVLALPPLAAGAAAHPPHRILHGLPAPVYVAAPAGDDRLFVVLRGGAIRIYDGQSLLPTPFLDLDAVTPVNTSGEGGLLGLAFAPDYATTRAFYVYYTTDGPDSGHPLTARLSRFRASADPNVADPAEKVLLSLVLPTDFHHGGTVAFGPDGYLYLGLGDGGPQGDPDETGQRGDTLLGKMLRLDVSFTSFTEGYSIPPDNPFVGDPTTLDEIWDLGFRNPFRFSFDRDPVEGGALYIGDVGLGSREEIDVEPDKQGGRNYGWDTMEGTLCSAEPPSPGQLPCNDPGLTLPVYDYDHSNFRCAVTGGVVYRGSDPGLQGQYLFGDYCTGEIWSFEWDGAGGTVGGVMDRTAAFTPDAGSIDQPVAFGEDGHGEVYIVDLDGEVFAVPEPGRAVLLVTGALVFLGCSVPRRRPSAPPL